MIIFSTIGILSISEEVSLFASIFLQLAVFLLGAYLVWKNNLKETLKGIGFPGSIKNTFLYTIGGMIVIFIFLCAASFVLTKIVDASDQQKVSEKILSLPRLFLIYAVIGAPIAEELLFRAGLVPRIGIVGSSAIFGLVHILYGSVSELVGTAAIGLVLAVTYKKSGSITPCILIHMLFNFMSVLAMLYVNHQI